MKQFWDKLKAFWAKTEPARKTTAKIFRVIGNVFCQIGKWIYRLRGVLFAIPVALGALFLANYNMANLPEQVGLNLLANGQYETMVTRDVAVFGPLAITAACLLLVFLSRRIIYPWLISIFSLALPLLIYFTNVFPA